MVGLPQASPKRIKVIKKQLLKPYLLFYYYIKNIIKSYIISINILVE